MTDINRRNKFLMEDNLRMAAEIEKLEAENKLMKQKAANQFGCFWKGGWYSQDLRRDMEGEA